MVYLLEPNTGKLYTIFTHSNYTKYYMFVRITLVKLNVGQKKYHSFIGFWEDQ
ncbi:hypothetical protein J31TS6_30580 [Brevibacillus reuszeri]|nr:hypothetical protein J31TS6_30580 [Brevibacillus reuszeri]